VNPWPPILASLAPGGRSARHAHHALHIVLARNGDLEVTLEHDVHRAAGVITRPDLPHAIDGTGRDVLIVFVEPESHVGRKLVASGFEARLVDDAERRQAFATFPGTNLEAVARWLDAWIEPTPVPPLHPAIRRVLDAEDLPIDELATIARLSPSRLTHVFSEQVGVSLKSWLLWRKLQRAAASIVTGAPLARAANDAGFSDAAHMSRTFRRMLGLTPSELRDRSRSVQDLSAASTQSDSSWTNAKAASSPGSSGTTTQPIRIASTSSSTR
jgi:AraC-like DNA-binding protein